MRQYGDLEIVNSGVVNLKAEAVVNDPAFIVSDEGRIVYNSTEKTYKYNNGIEWVDFLVSLDSTNALVTTLGDNWINNNLSFNPTPFNALDNTSELTSSNNFYSVLLQLDGKLTNGLIVESIKGISVDLSGGISTKDVLFYDGIDFVPGSTDDLNIQEINFGELQNVSLTIGRDNDLVVREGSNWVDKPFWFQYENLSPSTVFSVPHNLDNQYCHVEVVDASTDRTLLDSEISSVVYNNNNELTVTLSSARPVNILVLSIGAASIIPASPTPTPTITPTNTVTPTVTPSPTPTPTITPTNTVTPTVTPSPTPGGPTDAFVAGGDGSGSGGSTTIDSFPFSSSFTTSTDIGNLSQSRLLFAANSGNGAGYVSGGLYDPSSSPSNPRTSTVFKFPFNTSGTSSTTVGSLDEDRSALAGHSSSTNAYQSAGEVVFDTSDNVTRFPFSSAFTTATIIGNLSTKREYHSGNSSDTTAYSSGGVQVSPGVPVTNVGAFPFSSPFVSATIVASLNRTKGRASSQNSTERGYISGNAVSPLSPTTQIKSIISFPFSSPFTTTVDSGELTFGHSTAAGSSSLINGYISGGNDLSGRRSAVESFPFSSPFTQATDIGDLTIARDFIGGGHQG